MLEANVPKACVEVIIRLEDDDSADDFHSTYLHTYNYINLTHIVTSEFKPFTLYQTAVFF